MDGLHHHQTPLAIGCWDHSCITGALVVAVELPSCTLEFLAGLPATLVCTRHTSVVGMRARSARAVWELIIVRMLYFDARAGLIARAQVALTISRQQI